MTRNPNTKAGPCARIDPQTGERTVVRSSPSRRTAAYNGQYGLWDDLCQTWRGGPYPTLSALAAALYQDAELQPARWAGECNPRPLTKVESRTVRKMMEEAG